MLVTDTTGFVQFDVTLMRRNLPGRDAINMALAHLFELGFPALAFPSQSRRNELTNKSNKINVNRVLEMVDLKEIFLIFFSGLILAFFVELCLYCYDMLTQQHKVQCDDYLKASYFSC